MAAAMVWWLSQPCRLFLSSLCPTLGLFVRIVKYNWELKFQLFKMNKGMNTRKPENGNRILEKRKKGPFTSVYEVPVCSRMYIHEFRQQLSEHIQTEAKLQMGPS